MTTPVPTGYTAVAVTEAERELIERDRAVERLTGQVAKALRKAKLERVRNWDFTTDASWWDEGYLHISLRPSLGEAGDP